MLPIFSAGQRDSRNSLRVLGQRRAGGIYVPTGGDNRTGCQRDRGETFVATTGTQADNLAEVYVGIWLARLCLIKRIVVSVRFTATLWRVT